MSERSLDRDKMCGTVDLRKLPNTSCIKPSRVFLKQLLTSGPSPFAALRLVVAVEHFQWRQWHALVLVSLQALQMQRFLTSKFVAHSVKSWTPGSRRPLNLDLNLLNNGQIVAACIFWEPNWLVPRDVDANWALVAASATWCNKLQQLVLQRSFCQNDL